MEGSCDVIFKGTKKASLKALPCLGASVRCRERVGNRGRYPCAGHRRALGRRQQRGGGQHCAARPLRLGQREQGGTVQVYFPGAGPGHVRTRQAEGAELEEI